MRAKTRMQRAEQVARWLEYHFPLRKPVKVQWVREIIDADGIELEGICQNNDDRNGYEIRLSFRCCQRYSDVISVMIHEWAHLRRGLRSVAHDREFWCEWYAPIAELYWDGGGYHESKEF